jgi:hypothetical protein
MQEMHLFICWSGGRSRSLAQIMEKRLPRIIDGLIPSVSTQIEKGSLWFDEVRAQLEKSNAGLICLTPENVNSPWIHYEAGALAASLGAGPGTTKIYTYLLGIGPSELSAPLAAYQSTVADRADTKLLVESIANAMGNPDVARALEQSYDVWWRGVQADIDKIPPVPLAQVVPDLDALFRRKTFDEPLIDCTDQRWVDRYTGAWETSRALASYRHQVRTACRTYVDDLYRDLCQQVDAYAMDVRAFLLEERHFEPDETGRLKIDPPGAAVACERRRKGIKARVSQLLDASRAPIFDEACRFDLLETFSEKKNLIHQKTDEIQAQLNRGKKPLPKDELRRAAVSDWDFDRIVFYLIDERRFDAEVQGVIERVQMELEKVRARSSEGVSHMPLHYSLGPLRSTIRGLVDAGEVDATKEQVARLLDDVSGQIEGTDAGGQMKLTLAEIRAMIGAGEERSPDSD